MRSSVVAAAALAVAANATPTFPVLDLIDNPLAGKDSLSGYFNLIASKVSECNLSRARMPVGLDGLPPPDSGTTVRHVAVGRGTQNYTCDADDERAAPKSAGAVATLFNATCMASLYPDVLSRIPATAVHFKRQDNQRLGSTAMAQSGLHYFTDGSTPHFDLDTSREAIGQVACAKDSSSDAPKTAATGQLGEKAVAWLRLKTKSGTTGEIKHVYRVDTAGGSAPTTCKDMPSHFQVEYAAVYWFWQKGHGE